MHLLPKDGAFPMWLVRRLIVSFMRIGDSIHPIRGALTAALHSAPSARRRRNNCAIACLDASILDTGEDGVMQLGISDASHEVH